MKIKLNPVILIGTTISISLSIILYLINLNAISDILFGLLGVVITILIDLSVKTNLLEANVLQTLYLNKELVEDGSFYDNIVDVIKCFQKIRREGHHQIFWANAEVQLCDFRNHLKELASGFISLEPYDFELQDILVKESHKSIKATSLVDLNWWYSPAGQNYLNANIKAAKRGVKITRIFITDDIGPKLFELLKIQSRHIEVHYANFSTTPPELRLSMIISDDKLAWFSQLSQNMQFDQHHVSSKVEEVKRAVHIFNSLLLVSKPYKNQK